MASWFYMHYSSMQMQWLSVEDAISTHTSTHIHIHIHTYMHTDRPRYTWETCPVAATGLPTSALLWCAEYIHTRYLRYHCIPSRPAQQTPLTAYQPRLSGLQPLQSSFPVPSSPPVPSSYTSTVLMYPLYPRHLSCLSLLSFLPECYKRAWDLIPDRGQRETLESTDH